MLSIRKQPSRNYPSKLQTFSSISLKLVMTIHVKLANLHCPRGEPYGNRHEDKAAYQEE